MNRSAAVTLARRVQQELYHCRERFKESGITLSLCDGADLTRLIGTISGPLDSPYEGGTFRIRIDLSDDYPFSPPTMHFVTKVWHPNISSETGDICADILKDNWIPAQTLMSTLISLQALLSVPEPNDPMDAMVADQFLSDHSKFLETACAWTKEFAMASSS